MRVKGPVPAGIGLSELRDHFSYFGTASRGLEAHPLDPADFSLDASAPPDARDWANLRIFFCFAAGKQNTCR